MASKAAPGDASPSRSTSTATSSSVSLPIHDQKGEATPEGTISDQKQETDSDDDVIEAPMFHKPPPRQFALIMIALSLCVFLASLDQIIVSTSIPAITSEYNSLGDISWLGTAYLMTATSFQPLYGNVTTYLFATEDALL